ncbi:MFS transporter [Corynebacterium sp. 153RC1]|uniref:MFS transporter n=1 Tax=unclassified Corynebacterium TaxID=2624378 RepID=UPI00211C1A7D|nr:MFS transporter [Corynebacterium sp. 209RC1]MCQ9353741.1 MFS transporter [Corynebacterium sp. 1222RC1]MCQ9356275.1 MFS transporter [Corynebacterium sp. 122RC1]MCQ9358377.1 MFS transporter [Corynebacterium sp. 142RC1]MCQ9360888.1 MFS transporter [Corynebacterium sp. 153RC1]MCQ9362822.1 MFS transporter [Corynebacterium sp. 732RC1]MCQ9365165.1 MFS transporter [Corynebacterium sp. 70RC1]MCQ9370332.1 MFS transporter [Corynebacterium sp. 35RC1]
MKPVAIDPKPKIPREIWVLVIAAFVIAVGFGIIAPVIPQFAMSFGVGMAAAGAVVSVFAGTRLLFAPMSGTLVDAIGSRGVYITGLWLVAITTIMCFFAQEYWQLMLFRGLSGFGSTMFTVSAMGLVVRLSPPTIRAKCSSAYASGFLFGNIVGPILGSVLAVFGMRMPFLIYGIFVTIAGVMVWLLLPSNVGKPATGSAVVPPMRFADAWASWAYRASLVSGFAHGWSNFGVRVAVVPLFAATAFSNGPAVAGIAMTAFAVGNAVVLQFSGRLADTYGRKPLILCGLVINGLSTAVFGYAHDFTLLLVASAVAGAGAGLLNPAQQAVMADIVGTHSSGGKVLAYFQMSMDFGAVLGPIIIGAAAQAFGFGPAFVLCGALSLVATLAWIAAPETLTGGAVGRAARRKAEGDLGED